MTPITGVSGHSSSCSTKPLHDGNVSQLLEVQLVVLVRHMLAARDTVDLHLRVKLQVIEQLRRDEEVLTCTLAACDIDHAFVYHAFVTGIHALIDLVHDAERRASEILESHEIEDG